MQMGQRQLCDLTALLSNPAAKGMAALMAPGLAAQDTARTHQSEAG
jgi:hypothetical protein